jgi:hypothetical protein
MKECPCKKPADTDFTHLGPLCKDCFRDVIERRCRKAAKDAGWLNKGQKVHVFADATLQGKALDVLFKQVFKDLPLSHVPADQAEVFIIGKTADDEAEDFLQQLFSGKVEEKPHALNLFSLLTTAELERYCELHGIVGEKRAPSALREQLNALDKRYPGTFFGLQKSQDSLRKNAE